MKYGYRYLDEMVDMIEHSPDEAIKMAIVWSNQKDANLKALMNVLYDYRCNFEVGRIPSYQRKRAPGIDFHTAVKLLEQRLNSRVLGASQKFNFLIDQLQQLQDRDAEVLEKALTGHIDLGIPFESIQRAYPEIKRMPETATFAPKVTDLTKLKFPATIVRQLPTPEVRVFINNNGNFKFIDETGKGLVLPDKPKSVFNQIFKPFSNVVLSCSFVGLTKDKTKVGNTATSNAAYAKFQTGELEDETIGIRILDIADIMSYLEYPEPSPNINLSFERRRAYLEKTNLGDNIFCRLADVTKVTGLEALRAMEDDVVVSKDILRFYEDKALYADGFKILTSGGF